MKQLHISTKKKNQIIDITDELESELPEGEGNVSIFIQHTTCSLTTADLDPGTDEDFLEFLQKIIPDIQFRHPHDPNHAPDHILSSIIGSSLVLPYKNRQFLLGAWQRVVLVEFDGPRNRNIVLSVLS